MRTFIINELMKSNGFHTYLELGVDNGHNFKNVNAVHKRGVDIKLIDGPNSYLNQRIYVGSTNEYFENSNEKFDLIFIDADHNSKQFVEDVNNSLTRINDNGIIVCHDIIPEKEVHQQIPRVSEQWTGDVWKGWMRLRNTRADLKMVVIDKDWGCGLIKFGSQKCTNLKETDMLWSNFRVRKNKWLPIVKDIPDDFKR